MVKGATPAEFTDEYRANVCQLGHGSKCCRYLTMGADGFKCAKRTSLRFTIDARASTMNAQGDNCDGIYEPQPPFKLLKEHYQELLEKDNSPQLDTGWLQHNLLQWKIGELEVRLAELRAMLGLEKE
jgi:hypothetical protein